MSLNEVEQENFDAEEFIDRYARKHELKYKSVAEFDNISLHTVFLKAINDLKIKKSQLDKQIEEVEKNCISEEQKYCTNVAKLLTHNQSAFEHFNGLDDRISFVASKVVHLGDQLHGVSIPRNRAAEAQQLMRYFSNFLEPDHTPLPNVFNNPSQLSEAADLIEKLYSIIQELPSNNKFDHAKKRIMNKYEDIEKQLKESFSRSFQQGDVTQMKKLAVSLSHFDAGYTQTVDNFIRESQVGTLRDAVIFDDVLRLCTKMNEIVPQVFTSPQEVIDRLINDVFRGKLQESIRNKLSDRSNMQEYLQNLASMYQNTSELTKKLDKLKTSPPAIDTASEDKSDPTEPREGVELAVSSERGSVEKMMLEAFKGYLDTYLRDEKAHLRDRSNALLNNFYDNKKHVKKPVGGMSEFRRDVQSVFNTKISTLAPFQDNSSNTGDILVSTEVTNNLISLFREAFIRCQKLSAMEMVGVDMSELFMLCVSVLFDDYVIYAVDVALIGIETRTDALSFFQLLELSNSFKNSFDKLFWTHVHPSLTGSIRVDECVRKKKQMIEILEKKLDNGLDKVLNNLISNVRNILSDQKKSDFKLESSSQLTQPSASQVCEKVTKFMKNSFREISSRLDGANLKTVEVELLVRFHRVLYDHILQFQYTSIGAMMLICDVNEYRKWVKSHDHAIPNRLFEMLHCLCNLLIVLPENVHNLCSSEELSCLDKGVLMNFVQLRSDYKNAKIHSYFK